METKQYKKSEFEVEIEIVQPGRPTGIYRPIEYEMLRLEKILYPEEVFSFDLGILPKTLNANGDPLQVILLGKTSHPPYTRLTARLLGSVRLDGAGSYLIVAQCVDRQFEQMFSFTDLGEDLQTQIYRCLQKTTDSASELRLADNDTVHSLLKEAWLVYKQARAEGRQAESHPAWRPANTQVQAAGYTEHEHYTAAEYTFFQLPSQIQYYISSYLDNDERILYAVRRPSMRSFRRRSWLGREKLKDGVLILTTRQLIHLVELVPRGAA